jgi:hypothetical protein
MPRRPRLAAGDIAYHVLNRRVGRLALFGLAATNGKAIWNGIDTAATGTANGLKRKDSRPRFCSTARLKPSFIVSWHAVSLPLTLFRR